MEVVVLDKNGKKIDLEKITLPAELQKEVFKVLINFEK